MIRRVLLGVVLATAVLTVGWGAGTLPASADDPTPSAPPSFTPPPLPDPSEGTPGPTYVITPGVGGSELPAPSDPEDVAKAEQEDRARQDKPSSDRPASAKPSKPSGSAQTPAAVAGPQSPLARLAHPDGPVGLLWRGLAAVVVVLVMFEITEVKRYLRRRRVRP